MLRRNSPAPIRITVDNASCPTTSSLPKRQRPWLTGRAFSFSVGVRSTRVERSAGTRPKRIAARIEIPALKASTAKLGCMSTSNGIGFRPEPPEASCDNTRLPQPANRMPALPAMRASRALSVSSCRTMRLRLAPRASRTEISFCRLVPRASSRFPTFAQAMSNTRPTIAVSVNRSEESCLRIHENPLLPGCTSTFSLRISRSLLGEPAALS